MGEARRLRRERERLVALAAYASGEFATGEDGKRVAPAEFRLFHAGVNHTSKGDFVFDDIAAQLVMEAYAARNHSVPMMGDYEHQSLATPPIKALASCTQFVPAIRRDANGGPELWATEVQWTDMARAELEAGQYRMYSPAFVPDESGRIAALINFALTNLPASYEIAPLVAASASANEPQGDPEMEEELKQLKAKVEELSAKLSAAEGDAEKMRALCLKRLGKSFEDWAKEEDAEHASLAALKAKVLELTGKSDVAEALSFVALAVTQGKELVALKQQIADEKTRALEAEFTTTLDAAVAGGKLPPAGAISKEFFVGLKADFGTEKALAALKKAVPADAKPIVTLSSNAPHEPNPTAAVSGIEMEIASQMGGRFGGADQFKALREAELKRGTPTA